MVKKRPRGLWLFRPGENTSRSQIRWLYAWQWLVTIAAAWWLVFIVVMLVRCLAATLEVSP